MIALAAITLAPLLSSCAKTTEYITTTETIYVLPPVGLVVPCRKPRITATTPTELAVDTLKLKSALRECAQYADDYLNWRKMKHKPD
ncbi:Rz1-like lysis system protein LysC [Photobacterium toruni]|uniref:Rz1-like lysis system protein LysC n=1 Tax=Photobacterium toruni TaxID=1935446 RepID=UPI003F74C89E